MRPTEFRLPASSFSAKSGRIIPQFTGRHDLGQPVSVMAVPAVMVMPVVGNPFQKAAIGSRIRSNRQNSTLRNLRVITYKL
jgi:hypothetical protein